MTDQRPKPIGLGPDGDGQTTPRDITRDFLPAQDNHSIDTEHEDLYSGATGLTEQPDQR